MGSSILSQQISHNGEPFGTQRLPANGLACPTVPVGCVALIAFLAMQVRREPKSHPRLRPAEQIRVLASNRPWHPTRVRRGRVSVRLAARSRRVIAKIVQGHLWIL